MDVPVDLLILTLGLMGTIIYAGVRNARNDKDQK